MCYFYSKKMKAVSYLIVHCLQLCEQSNHSGGKLDFMNRAYKGIKKLIVSRQPILINLKSNTMKNTVQR